ncbi:MAG TPA: gliding motility-associated C-terminal domain-containing protein, partial [Panacibacter sp.]|nr:gliding motility-associated C-terminal domain-containing protein [Panacibacter sp.]
VQTEIKLPAGLTLKSAAVSYTGNSGGPVTITNTGSATDAVFGDFNISPGDTVIIVLTMQVDCNTIAGIYNGSAQSVYLDPTRTLNDPVRKITGYINAFAGTNTVYETGLEGTVPGANYNGYLPGSTAENIIISAVTPLTDNTISAPQPAVFCVSGDAAAIINSLPAGGAEVYTYQWQSSADGNVFTDIIAATQKDFDPAANNTSTYYRRIVSSLSCVTPSVSNSILITVDHKPTVDFLTPDICLKDGAALFTNQSSIDNGTVLSYEWNFGDPSSLNNTSAVKDPKHAYSSSGNYVITLTVTSGSCIVTVAKPFTVNGSIPRAGFIVYNEANLCSGSPVEFADNATVDFGEITKIEWYYDFGNNPSVVQTDNDPEKRGAPPRIYSENYLLFHSPESKETMVRMVVYSGISCMDEITVPLTLKAMPEVGFTTINPVCSNAAPFQITQAKEIYGVLAGAGNYSGDGINSQGLFNPALTGPGTHTITYTYDADNGCTDFKTQAITVNPAPSVTGGSVEVLEGGQILLPATAAGTGLLYEWTPATALSATNILNPVATPVADITYMLKVLTAEGCSASDIVVVKVLKNPVIPNAFSPNGDGINDVWNIQSLNTYPDATVDVFNRYGQKVFSTHGYATPWNGKYNNKDLPAATYYYIIDTGKGRKPIAGSVTILR